VIYLGLNLGLKNVGEDAQCFGMMVARDGVEPPPPAFSRLRSSRLLVIT